MLTPDLPDNKAKREGEERNRDKAKAGTENEDLKNLLNKFQDKSKRNISQLENFFREQNIPITIYKKDNYFCPEGRNEYFDQICDSLLTKSLIFVDPDIGLEVTRTREKHVKYSEVKNLYTRMGKKSILMIFQFIPHEKREAYFARIRKELRGQVGKSPLYISDNQIAFFFWTKDEFLEKLLNGVISDYGKSYSKLIVGSV
jgi:hypothetical protein